MEFNLPGAPPGLKQAIERLLRQKLSFPWRLWNVATANLPTPSVTENEGAILYDETTSRLAYSDGSNWLGVMPYTAGAALTRTNDTNVTVTLGGSPTTALLAATSLTLGWSGTLAAGRGGTGVSSLGNITRVDDTNVTLTLGGTPTGAVITSTSFTLGWSGTLAVSRGGTGGGSASGTLLDNITGFSSTGMLARTASATYAFRTITGTANEITVADGNGVSANPTLSLPTALTFTGKTVTGGTLTSMTSYSGGAVTATSGNILASTGFIRCAGTAAGIGYTTGAGSTAAQGSGSGKATTVTLNRPTGEITMDGATLNAATSVTFTFNNSAVAAVDMLVFVHHATGTFGAYKIDGRATGAGTASVTVTNVSAGNLGEAIVLKFAVIKCVTS